VGITLDAEGEIEDWLDAEWSYEAVYCTNNHFVAGKTASPLPPRTRGAIARDLFAADLPDVVPPHVHTPDSAEERE
jgi:hypothetical protein